MKRDLFETLAAAAVGVLTALAIMLAVGCGAAPPNVESGRIRGSLTIESPTGPIVVDLDTLVVVAPSDGWSVSAYEAEAEAVLQWQGIAHRIGIDARGKCVRVSYTGVAAVDVPIPGTECATPETPEPPTSARPE